MGSPTYNSDLVDKGWTFRPLKNGTRQGKTKQWNSTHSKQHTEIRSIKEVEKRSLKSKKYEKKSSEKKNE